MSQRRRVIKARNHSWRGSVLGGDTSRRVHGWHLELECGHIAERPYRFPPRQDSRGTRGGWHPRNRSLALPAPKSVRCDLCQPQLAE
jgi:hypothetical protein